MGANDNQQNGEPGQTSGGSPTDSVKQVRNARSETVTFRGAMVRLLNPVPLIAILIIGGVMFLLACAIFNLDYGHVLTNMGQTEFARGLITYLFTVVTIGTAVVLIVSALLGGDKENFERGKEILGLMLGVFGTIVGFYFGSALSHPERNKLTLTPLLLSAREAVVGDHLTLTTFIQGGTPPYHYGVSFGDKAPKEMDLEPRADGWVVHDLVVPETSVESEIKVRVGVVDESGEHASATGTLRAKPKSQ